MPAAARVVQSQGLRLLTVEEDALLVVPERKLEGTRELVVEKGARVIAYPDGANEEVIDRLERLIRAALREEGTEVAG